MGSRVGGTFLRAGLACAVLLWAAASLSPHAVSAEYPRRVAIAPFTSLATEDIQQTVAVLPRLLSSRLMALSGASVLLLPSGEGSPVDSAKAAGVPVLLHGSVAKLGKGYSIDVTAIDLATGKTAGAFFGSAANEDEIIPQLGLIATDISEKLFGVKPVVRSAPQVATGPQAPAAPALSLPPAPSTVPSAPKETAAVTGPGIAAAPAGTPAASGNPWTPTAMKAVSQSDKIADELYGIVAGDVDEEGNGEVIAYGKRTLYLYRIKGVEIAPYTRITRGMQHHVLNVEATDLDGDGRKEILVTDLVGDNMESFILKRKGDVYEEAAGKIPYFLVVLPDWMGKPTVVGQRQGLETPFQGKLVTFRWDGKRLMEGETLPHNTNIFPLSWGIPGLSSVRMGDQWRLIHTDEAERLRVVASDGKSEYRSGETFGTGVDFFEWGPYVPLEGSRKRFFLRKAARSCRSGGDRPLVLIPEVKKGILSMTAGSYDSTRLVLLQWQDGQFSEKAGTPKSDYFYSGADVLSTSGLRQGGKVIASVIEQMGSVAKDPRSRLTLFHVE
jgi:hypothetical protein